MTEVRHKVTVQPGNRPCAVCARPMSENAHHHFDGPRIRVICTLCAKQDWYFDDQGQPRMVTIETALQQERLYQMARKRDDDKPLLW